MDQTLIRAFRLFSVSENFLAVEDTLSRYKTIPMLSITIHLTCKIQDRANSSNVYIESCGKVSIVSTRGTKRKKRQPKRKKQKRSGQVLSMIMIDKKIMQKWPKWQKGHGLSWSQRKQKLRQRTGWFQTRDKVWSQMKREKLISGSVAQLVGLSMSPDPQKLSISA